MRIEMLPGMTNVVRFPVERRARPTLDLLRDLAPDVREVLLIAETFDIEAPAPDLRARADRETAEYILNQVAGFGGEAVASVDALLEPVVTKAVAACRVAHDASTDAAQAQQVLQRARTAGHFWIDPLRERAEALMLRSAELLIEAHARYEEAEGVARAVGLARDGETWTPRDHRTEEEALFGLMVRRAI
jgi:hypothetical protein